MKGSLLMKLWKYRTDDVKIPGLSKAKPVENGRWRGWGEIRIRVAKSESGGNFKVLESCMEAIGCRGIIHVEVKAVEEARDEAY